MECGACRLEVQPWDLSVLRLPRRVLEAQGCKASTAEKELLVSKVLSDFAGIVADPRTPLAAAVREGAWQVLVLPRSAAKGGLLKRCKACNGEDGGTWVALQTPSSKHLRFLAASLALASISTLTLPTPPAFSSPAHALVRKADLGLAVTTLVAAGYAIGPYPRRATHRLVPLPKTGSDGANGDKSGGVIGLLEPGNSSWIPYAVRFESGGSLGVVVDVRIPTRSCSSNSSVSADSHLREASSCGVRILGAPASSLSADQSLGAGTASARPALRRVVSFCPPSCASPASPGDDAEAQADCGADALSTSWKRLGPGGATAVLELIPHPCDRGQRGYWIFAGGFFGLVTGLGRGTRGSLVGGYCCRDEAQLRRVCADDAVDSELRSQFDAVLGKVVRPGLLRILRRSWMEPLAPEAEQSEAESGEAKWLVFYDAAESGRAGGGSIVVDAEAALVVHRFFGGGEQRWRILSMEEDPFTPPGAAARAAWRSPRSEEDASADERLGPTQQAPKSRSPSIVVFEQREEELYGKETGHGNKKHQIKEKQDKRNVKESDKKKDPKGKDKDRKVKTRSSTDKDRDRIKKSKERAKEAQSEREKAKAKKRKDSRGKSGSRSLSRRKAKARSGSRQKTQANPQSRSRSKARATSSSSSRSKGRRKASRTENSTRDQRPRRSRSLSRRRPRRAISSQSRSRKRVSPVPVASRRGGGFDARAPLSESVAPGHNKFALALPGGTVASGGINLSQLMALAPAAGASIGLPTSAAMPSEPNPEVEAFLAMNPVEINAGARLRMLPPHLQKMVIDRGSLHGARDASAVLNSRIRDAMVGNGATGTGGLGLPAPPAIGIGIHPGVEGLIARYGLDAQCAQLLRHLPVHLQALAADLPVHEARNPSAFVMAQLQLPRFRNQPAMPPPPPGAPGGGVIASSAFQSL